MGASIRVLHVLSDCSFSGAENVVCQIIHMFRQDEDVEMLYCSPDGPIREALAERNVNFRPLASVTVPQVRAAIAQWHPTVVHAHDMKASLIASLACGKLPLISHIHNNDVNARRLTPKALLYTYAALKAKHIFWVSPSAMNSYFFQPLVAGKSTMLRNVINMADLRAMAQEATLQEDFDILYLGRLKYPKDPLRMAGILIEACRREPALRCGIVGTGNQEDEVRATIASAGMTERIPMLGYQSNAYGLLRRAKVLIMTSEWEGTPMAALEAMALGVPIVSTPVDGLLDLVEQGKTGYLSGENEELINACLKIARDSGYRAELSRNTLQKAGEILNLEIYRKTLREVYEA